MNGCKVGSLAEMQELSLDIAGELYPVLTNKPIGAIAIAFMAFMKHSPELRTGMQYMLSLPPDHGMTLEDFVLAGFCEPIHSSGETH